MLSHLHSAYEYCSVVLNASGLHRRPYLGNILASEHPGDVDQPNVCGAKDISALSRLAQKHLHQQQNASWGVPVNRMRSSLRMTGGLTVPLNLAFTA